MDFNNKETLLKIYENCTKEAFNNSIFQSQLIEFRNKNDTGSCYNIF